MAINNAVVGVTTTATALNTAEARGSDDVTLIINNMGTAIVYLGTTGLTTANGFPLAPGATLSIDLRQGEQLLGLVASGTVNVGVLRSGVS